MKQVKVGFMPRSAQHVGVECVFVARPADNDECPSLSSESFQAGAQANH